MRKLGLFWTVVLVLPPLVALSVLPPFGERMVILIGIYALMGVGYQLVFGQLGALNLAQGALFGLGAYALALLAPATGLLALPLTALVAAATAALVCGPLLRLQSHYFALATLALAALVNLVAVHAEDLTGGANGLTGFTATLPAGTALLVLVWVCLIAAVLAHAHLFRGPLGHQARLLRDAPLAAATLGIDGGRWRFSAFVAGAALAGLAGGFSATLSGVVSPDVTGFPIMILCLTSVVLGGSRHPLGAVLGASLAVCLPELLRDLQGAWLLAYAAATLIVVRWTPEGLAALIDRWRGTVESKAPMPALPHRLSSPDGPREFALEKVSKSFGGVAALSDISFTVDRGEVVGLIGPNGSGKSTLLNVIGGLERPDGGAIRLDARRIDGLPPHRIAHAGIGRTFQTLPLADDTRLDDIVRAIASGALFLLLDEPAAGMSDRERRDLARLIDRVSAAGRGVLIVDHDLDLLTRVCDRLVCLDRGKVIAVGRPAEVRADPRVRATFLGLDEVAA